MVKHIPVLLHEVIRILDPQQGEFFVDGTIDGGGHAAEILTRIAPDGMLLGVDWDANMIASANQKFSGASANIILIHDNYARLPEILQERKLPKPNGLLLDLGFSSEQISQSGRGFSFNPPGGGDEPLLMTYSDEMTPVRDILRQISEKELAKILRIYGEERFAQRIARAIKTAGRRKPITTSRELSEIIRTAVPLRYRLQRIPFGKAQGKHPATRTFQALRIYANQELENLQTILSALPTMMQRGGRAAIISFHSLEDRMVKTSFRQFEKDGIARLSTKKPLTPSAAEIRENPRSRSAKLRGIVFST